MSYAQHYSEGDETSSPITLHKLGKNKEKLSEGDSQKQAREAQQVESLPWVEKYRPKQFDELIAHGDILSTCMKLLCDQ